MTMMMKQLFFYFSYSLSVKKISLNVIYHFYFFSTKLAKKASIASHHPNTTAFYSSAAALLFPSAYIFIII